MKKSTVLIVHPQSKGIVLGDSIRIKKISQVLRASGFQVIDVRFPFIDRNYIFSGEGIRSIFQNFLPFRNSVLQPISFSVDGVINYLGFDVSLNYLLKIFVKLKPDLVLAETSLVGWVTSQATKKLGIPCIVDVHGLAFAEAKGYGRKNWLQVLSFEKETFQNCDYLIVVSKKMKEYILENFGIAEKKLVLAPNGGDLQRTTARYSKPLNLIYAGIFSYWEKVPDFLEMAKLADHKVFRFHLAGSGSLKNQLIKRIKDERIPINYLGYIKKQEIQALFSKMQIGIAPSTKDLARRVASPIKVFDYMASGLPVVTPRVGDWSEILKHEDCGIVLDDDSISNYVEALNSLSQESIWTKKSGNAIKAIREKYCWAKVLNPIAELVTQLSN